MARPSRDAGRMRLGRFPTPRWRCTDTTIRKLSKYCGKLRRHFYLVNLHFNNWSCTTKAAPLPAWAYQTHWVNKRIGLLDATVPVPAPMSPLNAPDPPTRPDCQLATPPARETFRSSLVLRLGLGRQEGRPEVRGEEDETKEMNDGPRRLISHRADRFRSYTNKIGCR